ncbi:hypothetical protein [Polyangium mundeleinium]|uniref:Lipoprotein n=1 Tax=Polyangium mundeleinium TaxID=2995306 RepID=A0ABT5F0I6_9BACT|nr:hypothetical protein [Polyangium mundeleinium]MDC0747591.1 hypothetical protein [Polyangium mundeleinium]
MKKLVGSTALALMMALPEVACAQPFPDCQSASNDGHNTGELIVGQMMARVACDRSSVNRAVDALPRAVASMRATWGGGDALKRCYFSGFYSGLIARLALEHAVCREADPSFPALSTLSVGKIASATFLAALNSGLLMTPNDVNEVFIAEHGFLDRSDPTSCRKTIDTAELGIVPPMILRTWGISLDVMEMRICQPF